MTNKDLFIYEVTNLIIKSGATLSEGGQAYFEALKTQTSAKEKVELTENGAKILAYMQNNRDSYNNIFKSRDIAEGLFVSSRSVSSSMKKLITEGFVEKIGTDPVVYGLTDKGANKEV